MLLYIDIKIKWVQYTKLYVEDGTLIRSLEKILISHSQKNTTTSILWPKEITKSRDGIFRRYLVFLIPTAKKKSGQMRPNSFG